MEEKSLLVILTALVTALGVKEIWKIIKKKVDHASSIDEKQIDFTHNIIIQLKEDNERLQEQLNQQHKMMIEHERKISELLTINKHLRETIDECSKKMESMEKRLMNRVKKSSNKKIQNEK